MMTSRQIKLGAGISALGLLFLIIAGPGPGIQAQEGTPPPSPPTRSMQALLASPPVAEDLAPQAAEPCVLGMAGVYPCSNVDLLAFLPLSQIGGGTGNDLWGWTDPQTGKEYAIMGRSTGTAFVDISDPENPLYLGDLPAHSTSSIWRDIKVYQNHAFIVSEAAGHGMQVFDLTELRSVNSPPITFSETAHHDGFGNAHNLVLNPESGFAFAVGSNQCSGGLYSMTVANPANPLFKGCFSADGYTHDAQCVLYRGPDPDHNGKEVCFNANEDTLTIVDVTSKSNPIQLSRTSYAGVGYSHQGWLTEDQVYFLLDDELDELNFGHNTRTRVWDVSDLDNPAIIGTFNGPTAAVDHNLYNHNGFSFQANYSSGLRILSLSDVSNGNLSQVAFFDIYPANNQANFNGAWNVYPFFDSGVVAVSGIEQGLFILQPKLPHPQWGPQQSGELLVGGQLDFAFPLTNTGTVTASLQLTATLSDPGWSGSLSSLVAGPLAPGATEWITLTVSSPAGIIPGMAMTTTLKATSLSFPGIFDETQAISTGIWHAHYLPWTPNQ